MPAKHQSWHSGRGRHLSRSKGDTAFPSARHLCCLFFWFRCGMAPKTCETRDTYSTTYQSRRIITTDGPRLARRFPLLLSSTLPPGYELVPAAAFSAFPPGYEIYQRSVRLEVEGKSCGYETGSQTDRQTVTQHVTTSRRPAKNSLWLASLPLPFLIGRWSGAPSSRRRWFLI